MRSLRNFSRGLLVFTNVFFLLLGAVLITLGGYMILIPDLNAFSEGGISTAIIMCGTLILSIALLGWCGAQWESKLFLFPYTILVVISFVTQLALAGFMFHVHGSLLKIAANNFDLHVLSKEDRKILEWINHRFANAYDNCDLTVDLDMTTIHTKTLLAKCSNTEYEWFAAFVETNCRIGLSDLNPMSYFMQCAAGHFQVGDTLDEHTLLCACETKMIQWINDQSLLIAVVVGVIAFFEMILVFLSCYIMCTSTRRRYGYQEIRMPIKQRHPFNPHPRNFLHLHHTNNHTLQQQQQQQQQPLYPSSLHHLHTSYTTSTGTTSALPTNYHNKQDIQVIQHGTAI